MLDLAIVIVNYNVRDLLRDCLAAVYASGGDLTFEVCVVDNGSADGSADMVAAEFPQARLIRAFHTQVNISRRCLAAPTENAPTDVGGYTLAGNRAGCQISGLTAAASGDSHEHGNSPSQAK